MDNFIPRRKAGPNLIILLNLATLILWINAKTELSLITEYPLISIIQITALLGLTMMCINFMLATRSHFLEKLFGGLDQLYIFHQRTGKLAYIFILTHFLLNLVSVLPNVEAFLDFIIPGRVLGYTYGWIALVLLDIIILLTLFAKIPYHIWKKIHSGMIIVLIFAFLHIDEIGTDIIVSPVLRYWMYSLILISFLAYLYKIVFYPQLRHRYNGIVESVKTINNLVTEIIIKVDPKFKVSLPGQFAFYSFRNSKYVSKEEHPFTISAFKNSNLRISAKKSGDWTEKLPQLEVGTKVWVYGPYGMFGQEFVNNTGEFIFIAGGIGITPFLSMLQYAIASKNTGKIALFHSASSENELFYKPEILERQESITNLSFFPHISSQNGHLTAATILEKANIVDKNKAKVFICGPQSMMQALTKQLVELEIPRKNILFEEFALK